MTKRNLEYWLFPLSAIAVFIALLCISIASPMFLAGIFVGVLVRDNWHKIKPMLVNFARECGWPV